MAKLLFHVVSIPGEAGPFDEAGRSRRSRPFPAKPAVPAEAAIPAKRPFPAKPALPAEGGHSSPHLARR
jgi:hypothetical protein